MVVRIVAVTRFKGVPLELLGDGGSAAVEAAQQGRGSDCARLIECAGRTCYSSYGRGRSSENYHRHLLEVGHGSVLEHASISFFISGVSRGLTHELVRHRVGVAISQRSTRYCDESESEWAWHPLIRKYLAGNPPLAERVDDLTQAARIAYDDLVRFLQRELEASGVDKLAARKQARGAARGALGNALATELIMTFNLRALRGVLEQRCSEFADAEIRLLFCEIYKLAKAECPEFFSDYEEVPCSDGLGFGLATKHRKV